MRTILFDSSNAKQPMKAADRDMAALRTHTALAEMRNGTAREEEWIDLSHCVNLMEALATMGKVDHAVVGPLVNKAIDGLRVAFKCPDGQMRMGARDGHIQALTKVVAMHDDAIGKFSRETVHDAWQMVRTRIEDPEANETNGLFRMRQ